MSTTQRWLLVVAGVIGAAVFLLLTLYFGVSAPGHPHAKHMLLFIVLAVACGLVAWFAFPSGMTQSHDAR